MWIRNQSKKGLIDVNSLDVVGNKVMCKNWTLGEYETEKRALEVLDHIATVMQIKNHINFIYQMPKR